MTSDEAMTLLRSRSAGSRSCLLCAVLLLIRTLGGTRAYDFSLGGASVESQSEEGGPSGRRSFEHSSKIDTRNNSPALNHFLEDVLGAQEELKWIDRAVHRSADEDLGGSSRNSRKNGNRKSRREHKRQPPKPYKPQRIYLEDEIRTRREVGRNENSSSGSLASLKRTILELSDSLNPRDCEELRQNGADVFESKRRLLWSENLRSAMGVAIEYYDYEDGADSAGAILDNPVEREAKREDSRGPPVYPSKSQIPKKDENSEEERKEEIERQKLKNKYPKEEFINNAVEHRVESVVASGKNLQDAAPSPSNSLYNSMVLKRIPADPEPDDSDFYSQCKVGSLPDEPDVPDPVENPIIYEQHSLIDLERSDATGEKDETQLSGERTYFVISPGAGSKRSRKRSIDPMETSSHVVGVKSWPSLEADKSASNYFALKITDDMFKGGVEQSNPLGEDKPIESTSFSSSSSSFSPPSASGNSFALLRPHRPNPTTSTEWKVIEAVKVNQKMVQSKNPVQPERIFGRRLTQVIHENPPSHANFSSASPSSPTDNPLYSSTLTHQLSSSPNENSSHIDVTTHREDLQNNFHEVFHVSSGEWKNFSIASQSLAATTAQLYITTLSVHDASLINESQNNTRLRRHADSYGYENFPKRRRNKVRHIGVPEGVEGRKKLSGDAVGPDSHHRKLTVLLAADNVEDESQIDLAVHGELAGKIVERIFEEVQRNEALKVALGPGLYRKHKPQESMALDKMYRQGLDEDEVKETEAMMRRVMELLGRLVLDEVRRKTCASLAPDMRDFLQWSLGIEELVEPLSDQVPPLPLIPGNRLHDATERHPPSADKFLFPSSPNGESLQSGDLSELERKVALLKSLINEYRTLTERERTKVQTVHDYLVRQLALLMKYIESKEAAGQGRTSQEIQTAGARARPGSQHILQYQGFMPNRSFTKDKENGFNMTDNEANNSSKRHPTISPRPSIFSYFNGNSRENRHHRFDRRKRKHSAQGPGRVDRDVVGDHSSYDAGESLEYRKLLRRIASLRRKKREDFWGYEVPRIYSEPLELSSRPRAFLSTVAGPDQPITTSISLSDGPINSSRLAVRGKNRLEDEVLLLNKREAWRKENERLLEEVAFGKDTRNDLLPKARQSLFNRDQELRIKRAFDANISSISSTTSNYSLQTNETTSFDVRTDSLRSVEDRINVFPVEPENSGNDGLDVNLRSPGATNLV